MRFEPSPAWARECGVRVWGVCVHVGGVVCMCKYDVCDTCVWWACVRWVWVGVHVCVCARGGLQQLFSLITVTLLSQGLLMNPNSLTAARLAPGPAQSRLP